MKHAPWMATVIVVVRQLVAVLHGNAHDQLGVGLSAWQNAFVYMVIVVAPLVAAALYWTRYVQAGALLLGISMLAGMLFGIFFHFIHVSPDNVQHLPAGDGQGSFIATAILLVPIELAGTIYGFWSWSRLKKVRPATAAE